MNDDIARIFALDPQKCTDQDIMLVINEFRAKAHLFKTGAMMAGRTKPVSAKQEQTTLLRQKLNLKTMDL